MRVDIEITLRGVKDRDISDAITIVKLWGQNRELQAVDVRSVTQTTGTWED